MNRYLKIGLLLVFAVAICLTSGKVFNIELGTNPPDKVAELSDSTACFAEIAPDFAYYEYVEGKDVFLIYGKSDNLLCKVLFSMPYCADIQGYNGNVPLAVVLSPEDKVQQIHLLDNNETPSFLNRVVAQGFLENWNGLSPEEAVARQVDAVSGATFSSSAIKKSVMVRLENYSGSSLEVDEFGVSNNFIGFVVSMVYLLFAGFCFWEPQRTSKYRVFLLLASVGVLGFWQGQFISIAKLSSWLLTGVNWQMEIFLFIVLLMGIIAPLFMNKSFYCMYVCPFGACQELMGKVNRKHKLKISPKIAKWLKFVRYALLVFLGAILCTSLDLSIEYFEPFSAFKFQFASLAVLILAGVMLVLSVFVNRPWCNFFCPTGAFFSLFMDRNKKQSKSVKE